LRKIRIFAEFSPDRVENRFGWIFVLILGTPGPLLYRGCKFGIDCGYKNRFLPILQMFDGAVTAAALIFHFLEIQPRWKDGRGGTFESGARNGKEHAV
jgi:hypothetical protein